MPTILRKANLVVWEPRWHDHRVLLAKHKVKKGINTILITGAPRRTSAAEGRYELSEIAIRSYPIESNGTIPCYAVPLDKLRRIT